MTLLAGCAPTELANAPTRTVLPEGAARADTSAKILDQRGESVVCVYRPPPGKSGEPALVWKLDGTSPDGSHGLRVERASWSPGGRFLALQLTSSGGHQPQSAPIILYDVEREAEINLDTLLGEGAFATADGDEAPRWLDSSRLAFTALTADGQSFQKVVFDAVAMKVLP